MRVEHTGNTGIKREVELSHVFEIALDLQPTIGALDRIAGLLEILVERGIITMDEACRVAGCDSSRIEVLRDGDGLNEA